MTKKKRYRLSCRKYSRRRKRIVQYLECKNALNEKMPRKARSRLTRVKGSKKTRKEAKFHMCNYGTEGWQGILNSIPTTVGQILEHPGDTRIFKTSSKAKQKLERNIETSNVAQRKSERQAALREKFKKSVPIQRSSEEFDNEANKREQMINHIATPDFLIKYEEFPVNALRELGSTLEALEENNGVFEKYSASDSTADTTKNRCIFKTSLSEEFNDWYQKNPAHSNESYTHRNLSNIQGSIGETVFPSNLNDGDSLVIKEENLDWAIETEPLEIIKSEDIGSDEVNDQGNRDEAILGMDVINSESHSLQNISDINMTKNILFETATVNNLQANPLSGTVIVRTNIFNTPKEDIIIHNKTENLSTETFYQSYATSDKSNNNPVNKYLYYRKKTSGTTKNKCNQQRTAHRVRPIRPKVSGDMSSNENIPILQIPNIDFNNGEQYYISISSPKAFSKNNSRIEKDCGSARNNIDSQEFDAHRSSQEGLSETDILHGGLGDEVLNKYVSVIIRPFEKPKDIEEAKKIVREIDTEMEKLINLRQSLTVNLIKDQSSINLKIENQNNIRFASKRKKFSRKISKIKKQINHPQNYSPERKIQRIITSAAIRQENAAKI